MNYTNMILTKRLRDYEQFRSEVSRMSHSRDFQSPIVEDFVRKYRLSIKDMSMEDIVINCNNVDFIACILSELCFDSYVTNIEHVSTLLTPVPDEVLSEVGNLKFTSVISESNCSKYTLYGLSKRKLSTCKEEFIEVFSHLRDLVCLSAEDLLMECNPPSEDGELLMYMVTVAQDLVKRFKSEDV